MAQQYQAIVIGCGAIGAATTYWLSRRLGGGVLALEQYQHGHSRGASEDHSRVIRHAYSRPEYTALTPAAYQSWNVAERGTGLQLVYRTGGLILAEDEQRRRGVPGRRRRRDGRGEPAVRAAHRRRGDAALAAVAARQRAHRAARPRIGHPRYPPGHGRAHRAGPRPRRDDPGQRRSHRDRRVGRRRDGHRGRAGLLGRAGGAGRRRLESGAAGHAGRPVCRSRSPKSRSPTSPRRRSPNSPRTGSASTATSPTTACTTASRSTARSPPRSASTAPGRWSPRRPGPSPGTRRGCAGCWPSWNATCPAAVGPELYTRTCCYDFPPDRDFIADYVPGSQRVLVCAGAGHAGKFAALLGRILTELALDGSSRFPVSAFSATRPGPHRRRGSTQPRQLDVSRPAPPAASGQPGLIAQPP